ncbi:expressed unknown protein [Seminavis robusta]|uniref:Uncharacterized protein n=1 Tax=Seminavis robusta TaxID=568900 RepID=A0A9N8H7A0_9STRA|nr:expressed unknown protein [Seminavis robusta]|eukprot:Sro172_g075921.1  (104) ;mRNA; f:21835-22146
MAPPMKPRSPRHPIDTVNTSQREEIGGGFLPQDDRSNEDSDCCYYYGDNNKQWLLLYNNSKPSVVKTEADYNVVEQYPVGRRRKQFGVSLWIDASTPIKPHSI